MPVFENTTETWPVKRVGKFIFDVLSQVKQALYSQLAQLYKRASRSSNISRRPTSQWSWPGNDYTRSNPSDGFEE